MPDFDSFLADFRRRHWVTEGTGLSGLTPLGYYSPASGRALEVAVARAESKPTKADARRLWNERHRGRSTGVLLVVIYPDSDGESRAEVVGLYDDSAVADLDLSLVERRISEALDTTAVHQAQELMSGLFEIAEDGVQGLRNKGLFASHALEVNTPRRPDWSTAAMSARAARGARGEDLLRALGWAITPAGGDLLLRPRGRERDRAVAVLLEGDEVFDRPAFRYGLGVSPVEHGLEVARQQELPWVLAVRGATVRLYASDPDVGVTRTGAASFTELTVDLLDDDHLAYAWLLLTPQALDVNGTADELLRDSREHATSLGERLRERVYRDVIPNLSETIATKLGELDEKGLDEAYHHTLVVLFRLLFVAYAEDRGLLPFGLRTPAGAVYTRVSLKTRAIGYAEQLRDGATPRYDGHATDVWDDLTSIWDGVYHGHVGWGVPEYGGTLFRQDSPSGRAISGITLSNKEIEPALVALLVDTGRDGTLGPVDFQALSVREFGTIYEGLLESSLSLASRDLTLDKNQTYVPAKPGDAVVVPAGKVYFHNASGARKATGSYFTKEFAVEHLLETALDPTLVEHLDRVAALLDDGKEGDAAEALFDFRVADVAMGSGHFLVAAVDHLAAGMSGFLDRRPIPEVRAELDRIRTAAFEKPSASAAPMLPRLRTRRSCVARLRAAASTGSTSTRSPSTLRGSPCGSTPSCPGCPCRRSTMGWSTGTRSPGSARSTRRSTRWSRSAWVADPGTRASSVTPSRTEWPRRMNPLRGRGGSARSRLPRRSRRKSSRPTLLRRLRLSPACSTRSWPCAPAWSRSTCGSPPRRAGSGSLRPASGRTCERSSRP
jgi:hypothetical protein